MMLRVAANQRCALIAVRKNGVVGSVQHNLKFEFLDPAQPVIFHIS
jgi:hypothetical protein